MAELNFDFHNDRISLAIRRLDDAYHRREGAETPIVWPGGDGYRCPFTFEQRYNDLDCMLEHAVNWANALAATDNDWPPFLDTYCTVAAVAEAFGCEVVYADGSDPWAKPAVSDISQVWDLKPAPLNEVPMIRRTAEWVDYAQRKLGPDVPLWMMDLQSPLSVAAHILDGAELLMACVTHPKEVHHLLKMITEYSIEMMQAHIAQMENPHFPGRNFPSIPTNVGICVADDTPLIMLSPAMYAEFAIPYNDTIAEAFGGFHLHSCGDYSHNLDGVLRIQHLRAIQLHAGPGEYPLPTSIDDDAKINEARKRLTWFVDCGGVARGDKFKGRTKDIYCEYILPRLKLGDLTGLILQAPEPGQGLDTPNDALRWTREQISR